MGWQLGRCQVGTRAAFRSQTASLLAPHLCAHSCAICRALPLLAYHGSATRSKSRAPPHPTLARCVYIAASQTGPASSISPISRTRTSRATWQRCGRLSGPSSRVMPHSSSARSAASTRARTRCAACQPHATGHASRVPAACQPHATGHASRVPAAFPRTYRVPAAGARVVPTRARARTHIPGVA